MIILKNEQYYYWNKKSVSPWIKFDEEMNNKFSYVTKILFESINIKKNQSVLDVGCGGGFTSYHSSKKVGVNGIVTAIDISNPLLSLFKKKYNNIKNLSCIKKDLQKTSLEENMFDHAISRFGVMFFEYPLEAFKQIYKSLKKNGSLTFVCWTNFRCNQFFTIPAHSVSKKIKIDIPQITNKPGPFAFKDKSYVQKLLKKSGFKNITIKKFKTKLKINNVKTEIDIMMSIGIGARMLRENNVNKKTCDIIRENLSIELRKILKVQNHYNANIYLVTALK